MYLREFFELTSLYWRVRDNRRTISAITRTLFTTKLCTIISQITTESNFWHVLTDNLLLKIPCKHWNQSQRKLPRLLIVFKFGLYTFVMKIVQREKDKAKFNNCIHATNILKFHGWWNHLTLRFPSSGRKNKGRKNLITWDSLYWVTYWSILWLTSAKKAFISSILNYAWQRRMMLRICLNINFLPTNSKNSMATALLFLEKYYLKHSVQYCVSD